MATVKKGDLLTLNLDGTDRLYRVLKVDGNNAECLAMFDASTSQMFNAVEANSQIYAGSDLDIYLNTTWYNKLTDTAKSAIVPKTFTQDQWYEDDSGDPVYSGYFGSSSPGNMLYRVSLANSAFGSTITRNVYALSIQDVLDYVLDTAVGDGQWRNYNTWKMFWNDEVKHSLNHLWLRSAAKRNSTIEVFYLNGNYGTFSIFNSDEPFRVRPAFTIDLVKLGVIEPDTSTVITYNGSTIATLESGQTATIKTAQSEVEHDIVVKAAEQKEAVLQEKTATENGDVTPDEGYDGLSKVTVNVAASVSVPEWDGSYSVVSDTISFTIDGVSYEAEDGMTFYEFAVSDYNNGDVEPNSIYYMPVGGKPIFTEPNCTYDYCWTSKHVRQDTVIESGKAYYSMTGGF